MTTVAGPPPATGMEPLAAIAVQPMSGAVAVETPATAGRAVTAPRARSADRSWPERVGAATSVVASMPGSWPVALAGWLARGGVLLLLLPVVVLPTPTGLATTFGPEIAAVVLGYAGVAVVALLVAFAAIGITGLLVGSWIGAASEITLIRWYAAGLGQGASASTGAVGRLWRVMAVRLLAHGGTAIAVAWATARLVDATYAELLAPGDLAVPLVVRVVAAAPGAVAAIIVAWLVGEALGAFAARRVVLRGDGLIRALVGGLVDALRHPISTLATFALTALVPAVLVAPALVVASVAWSTAGRELVDGGSPAAILAAVAMFSMVWLAALALGGLGAAWRSALWTAESVRPRVTSRPGGSS
jgi:hypothetical protein